MSQPAIPWGSPSQYGRLGVWARRVVQRVLRPLIVRTEHEQALLAAGLEDAKQAIQDVIAHVAALAERTERQEQYIEAIDTVLGEILLRDLPPNTRIYRRFDNGSRRALCSQATGRGYRSLLSRSALSFERYAERWGWDLVLSSEDTAEGRPAPWGKVPFIRSLLDEYEWVLWLDADVVITDLDADISDVVRGDKDLYVVEHRWLDQYTVSSGVMLMRSSDWMRSLLNHTWSKTEYIDHPWREKAGMLDLLGYALDPARMVRPTKWLTRTQFIDGRWNDIGLDPVKRPAFVHRGFYDVPRRTRQVTADLPKVLGAIGPGP